MNNILHTFIMGIANRIKIIAEENDLSLRKLSLSIGKTSGYLSVIIRKNSEVGSDALTNILHAFPEYNLEWVLTGKGKKLKKEDVPKKYTPEDIKPTSNENLLVDPIYLQEYIDNKIESSLKTHSEKTSSELAKLTDKLNAIVGIAEIDAEIMETIIKVASLKKA